MSVNTKEKLTKNVNTQLVYRLFHCKERKHCAFHMTRLHILSRHILYRPIFTFNFYFSFFSFFLLLPRELGGVSFQMLDIIISMIYNRSAIYLKLNEKRKKRNTKKRNRKKKEKKIKRTKRD